MLLARKMTEYDKGEFKELLERELYVYATFELPENDLVVTENEL